MTLSNFEQKVLNICRDKNVVFIFISKDDEINTRPIINGLLSQNKTVVVPIIETEKDAMKISRLATLDDLTIGAYGICEPKKQKDFLKKDIDIFLVPGMVFDKVGNRKGRGKGYFDRFLADVKGKKPIVGLCYKSQIVKKLETNSWDVPVDRVIAQSSQKS